MSMQDDIISSAGILKSGGIILYPTDTIWGLGCDATNNSAVQRIFQLKNREDSKSMLILLDSEDKLSYYVESVPEIAYRLINTSDTPLTLIYPGARRLAPSLVAEDGSIGIRITSDPFCRELIKYTGFPLVSSSANFSRQPSPSVFREISIDIKSKVDFIVQWRQNDAKINKPSSIIKLEGGDLFRILRV